MAQDFDVTLKKLIDHFTEDYVRLVFGNVQMEIELLDRELGATKHFVDALAQLKVGDEKFIFHPEFFSEHEKDIPERMYKYSARIMDKYPGLGVYGVAFYINEADRNKPLPNVFERRVLGKVRNYYEYDVINIGELNAGEILRQKITGLVPLAPLMKFATGEAENIMREAVQQLQQQVDEPQLRSETFSALYLFSGMRQLQNITKKLLQEANMLEFLKKSEAYQEIRTEGLEEGLAKGLVEGLKEGETQGFIRSTLAILSARFGQLPQDFSGRFHGLGVSQLSDLVVKAMSIENLAAFEALIQNLKEKPDNGSARL